MIYIECDADEKLVRELGFGRHQFIHEGGKFELCKKLQRNKNGVGLIEDDKGESNPTYLLKCALIEEGNDIRIYLDKRSSNRLIVLVNDLEDWILKVARKNYIDVVNFGLEPTRNRMHRVMPGRLQSFQRLIAALLQAKCPEILFLQEKLKNT